MWPMGLLLNEWILSDLHVHVFPSFVYCKRCKKLGPVSQRKIVRLVVRCRYILFQEVGTSVSQKHHKMFVQPDKCVSQTTSYFFSSPEHKVLKVSYFDHPVSGVRRQASVVRRGSSTIHLKHISS